MTDAWFVGKVDYLVVFATHNDRSSLHVLLLIVEDFATRKAHKEELVFRSETVTGHPHLIKENDQQHA